MKIKRILSMVLVLVLSIGAMSITAFAAEETMYGIGFVNASSLRLRSEPDANSATLVYAPRNDCVAVISQERRVVQGQLQSASWLHASGLPEGTYP